MFSRSKVTGISKPGISAYAKKALMSIVVAGIVLGTASSISADPITVGVWHSFFRVDPVPEPASMVLLGTGLVGIVSALLRRRVKN